MRSIKKFLMLGVLAAMTAFCLAPGFALADEGGEPLSFDADGKCEIANAGTYYLATDTTGYVVVNTCDVTINLNGHTLTNTNAEHQAIFFYDANRATVNAGESEDGKKVGTIVQDCSNGAIRFDSPDYWNPQLTLNGVKVTAQDNQCLQLVSGNCELNNVDMSTDGGDSLIYVAYPNYPNYLTINSGTFVAGGSAELFKIMEGGSVTLGSVTLKGGSFNKLPEGYATKTDGNVVPPSIGDGYAMFKANDSSDYVVESESVVKGKSAAKVKLDNCRTVYFASLEEAESCVEGVTDAELVKCIKATIAAPENCAYNRKAKQAQWGLPGVADGADVQAVVSYTKDGASVDEAKDMGSYSASVTGLTGNDAEDYELVSSQSVTFEITKPDTNINQDSFDENGKCEILVADTYNLTQDVTGAIYISDEVSGAVTINLNGHTIKNTNSSNNVLFANDLTNDAVTIDGADDDGKNGTIEQAADGKGAIRLDSRGGTAFKLVNIDVKAQSNECLQAINGKNATLTNVSMSVSGKANSLIFVDQLSTTIESGTYKASDSMDAMFEIKAQTDSGLQKALTVSGGSFNKFPAGTTLASGKTLYKEANSDYEVVSTDDACLSKHCWKVTLTDQTQILYSGDKKDIYFGLEPEANAFAAGNYEVKEINKPIDGAEVSLEYDACTYDGTQKTPEVTSVVLDGKELTKDQDYTVSYGPNVDVGAASATVTGAGDYIGSVKKSFTISAKDLSAAKVTLATDSCVYDGTQKTPEVTSVVLDGSPLVKDQEYTVSYESNTDAGTAYVKVSGKGNYTGEAKGSFQIGALSIKDAKVTLGDSLTYNGSEQTQEVESVVVTSGGKEIAVPLDSLEIAGNKATQAGTYTMTLAAKKNSNFADSVTKEYSIAQYSGFAAAKVTLSKTSFTYNGKAQKPSVKSVVLNGKTLKAGTDYTASVASGKKVGTYNVTIAAKGSYTGKATASFVVNPKGVTKFKVSKAKKAFKAKWKKSKTERSGVQVKYSTKKSMKNAKTVKAKGASVKAKKVKKLKKKTKYYVQVRAYKVVNGKTYYSSWSAKKAVKTK